MIPCSTNESSFSLLEWASPGELVRGGRRVRVGKWVNLEIQNLKKESRITANGNIPLFMWYLQWASERQEEGEGGQVSKLGSPFMLYKAAEEKN